MELSVLRLIWISFVLAYVQRTVEAVSVVFSHSHRTHAECNLHHLKYICDWAVQKKTSPYYLHGLRQKVQHFIIRLFSVTFPFLKYKNCAQNTNISYVSLVWTYISHLQAFPTCLGLILGVKSCCNAFFPASTFSLGGLHLNICFERLRASYRRSSRVCLLTPTWNTRRR